MAAHSAALSPGVLLEVRSQFVLLSSLFCSNIFSLAADPGYFTKPEVQEPIQTYCQVMGNIFQFETRL